MPPAIPDARHARGRSAEQWVAERLEGAGWQVLARNWRAAGGELDLIVEKDGRIRFVEVKARRRDDALADDAVSPAQRSRLRRAANLWLAAHPDVREACFLVAWVRLEDGTVQWMDNAFDG